MSNNYNNPTFTIFKMNTDILTITLTNKRKNIYTLHTNTSSAYIYHNNRKIERSEVLLNVNSPHQATTDDSLSPFLHLPSSSSFLFSSFLWAFFFNFLIF